MNFEFKENDMYESDNSDNESKYNDNINPNDINDLDNDSYNNSDDDDENVHYRKLIVNELKIFNENENPISETDDFLGFINMVDLISNGPGYRY